jgi:hypothetical protein
MSAPTMHRCPCGCGATVARTKLACRAGWYRLPRELREAVTGAYRRRGTPDGRAEHMAAVRDAIRWYQDNRPGART